MSVFERGGHTLGRLADDFEIAHDRVLSFPIREEVLFTGCGVLENVLDGVSNVQQVDAVVLHNGTTSAWMRCSR
ncbi:MAG: hypothetical protein EWM72_02202 [Nitrospira sp.]|nr:MAG: hypothetical protein EWM72_02202 [Nitrospira sp.]